MEFLGLCLLLTQHCQEIILYDTMHSQPIPPEQNLFPREPCCHARREILHYLDPTRPMILHPSGHTYLASILSANGVNFEQSFRGVFFMQQFFSSLISVDNWAVSPHARPSSAQDHASIPKLHVFDFLRGMSSLSSTLSLLPASGLTNLQARHVASLIFYSFAAFDIKRHSPIVLFGTLFLAAAYGPRSNF
jgi:hypothetical protein